MTDNKTPNCSHVRREGFIAAHSLRVQSFMVGSAMVTGVVTLYTVSKSKGCKYWYWLTSSFLFSSGPCGDVHTQGESSHLSSICLLGDSRPYQVDICISHHLFCQLWVGLPTVDLSG